MRFKDFIVESKFDLEKFRKDCDFYFSKIENFHGYMWHGTKSAPTDWKINTFKERAGPRDSSGFLHSELNKTFEKDFKFPFRNGLFVNGRRVVTSTYGTPCAIFPIGKFEWLSSGSKAFTDMTATFDTYREKIRARPEGKEMDYDEVQELAFELMAADMKKIDWLHNEDLPRCIQSGAEIMLKCDKFYMFSYIGDTFETEVSPFTDNL